MNILGGVESSARYMDELCWRYMTRDKARNRCRIWLRMVTETELSVESGMRVRARYRCARKSRTVEVCGRKGGDNGFRTCYSPDPFYFVDNWSRLRTYTLFLTHSCTVLDDLHT